MFPRFTSTWFEISDIETSDITDMIKLKQLTPFPPSVELFLTLSFCVLLLTVVLIHYANSIAPNKYSIVYRVRRPRFLLYFMLVLSLTAILRSIIAILKVNKIVTEFKYYRIMARIISNFGTLLWYFVRMWLLFYDIKAAKYQQTRLISKILDDTTDIDDIDDTVIDEKDIDINDNNSRQYWLYEKKSDTFGDWKVLTKYMICFMFIWTLINISLDLTLSPELAQYFMTGTISICFIFYTFWMLSIWVVNLKYIKSGNNTLSQAISDHWYLGFELSILWFLWLALFGLVKCYESEPIILCWIAFIIQTCNLSTTMLIPYILHKKIKKTISNRTHTSTMKKSTLQQLLSTKKGFYAFSDFCVQELSIENLTFLVQIWQFKYQDTYNSLRFDKNEKNKENMIKSTIIHDTDYYDERENEYEALQSHSSSNKCSSKKSKLILSQFPWSDLPLSYFLINNTQKIQQAIHLHFKYIEQNAYYTLNISTETYDVITCQLKQCQIKTNMKKLNENELNELNQQILTIFDTALPEIQDILEMTFYRFKQSPRFKLLFV